MNTVRRASLAVMSRRNEFVRALEPEFDVLQVAARELAATSGGGRWVLKRDGFAFDRDGSLDPTILAEDL